MVSCTRAAIASFDRLPGGHALRFFSNSASAAMIRILQNAASDLQRATNCSTVTGALAGAAMLGVESMLLTTAAASLPNLAVPMGAKLSPWGRLVEGRRLAIAPMCFPRPGRRFDSGLLTGYISGHKLGRTP
jgi:hypothetical protein